MHAHTYYIAAIPIYMHACKNNLHRQTTYTETLQTKQIANNNTTYTTHNTLTHHKTDYIFTHTNTIQIYKLDKYYTHHIHSIHTHILLTNTEHKHTHTCTNTHYTYTNNSFPSYFFNLNFDRISLREHINLQDYIHII